jgi:phosphoribosylaminoimidazole-succinocarboxamide synthase
MKEISIRLYQEAAKYAASKGILIADTKFEFGLNDAGQMILMDEILTADSSRFWPASSYVIGRNPPSFDKQFVRDWLESVKIDGQPWNKKAPAPHLPAQVIEQTAAKYQEALAILTQ